MTEPLVVAVCVTRDRPEMLERAVRCFEAQTYQRKRLFIYDSSRGMWTSCNTEGVYHEHVPDHKGASVGELRNRANQYADARCLNGDIIMHLDDDDWSHSSRMTEQVALLQESGADAVGYSDCLFWDTQASAAWVYRAGKPNYAVGASLMYWRRTWETKPFPHLAVGEDTAWQQNLSMRAVTCTEAGRHPRIIATIHGGNTNMADYRVNLTGHCREFRRAEEWDEYCSGLLSADPTREASAVNLRDYERLHVALFGRLPSAGDAGIEEILKEIARLYRVEAMYVGERIMPFTNVEIAR